MLLAGALSYRDYEKNNGLITHCVMLPDMDMNLIDDQTDPIVYAKRKHVSMASKVDPSRHPHLIPE